MSKRKKRVTEESSIQLKYLTEQQVRSLYSQAFQQVEQRILAIHINRKTNPRDFAPLLLQEAMEDLRRLEIDFQVTLGWITGATNVRLEGT